MKNLPAILVVSFLLLAPAVSLGQVSGTIRDATTLQPIADAIVTLQGTDDRTTSDASGNYLLSVTGTDLVVVAAKENYYHGNGAPPMTFNTVTTPATLNIDLTPVPQTDDPNYLWRPDTSCGLCHTDQLIQHGDFNSPNPSPMGITGLNQWVYDLYNGTGTPGGMGGFVYTVDSIHAASFPEAECASCHQPQKWISNPFSALDDINSPSDDAFAGVSCEVCHKVADVANVNATGFIPGQVTVTRPVEMGFSTQQVMYGPLGDVDFAFPSSMYASYRPEIRTETCAVCHQYNSDPDQDLDFDEPSSFPGQTTYTEWLNSAYGNPLSPDFQTCADCHMPAAANDGCTIAPVPRIAGQIRTHDIRGTTPEFLENAGTLALSVNVIGSEAQVTVTVENDQTGHDLPTGIGLRNILLVVEAIPESGGAPLVQTGPQVLAPEAGVGDPALGYFAGLPGKIYGRFVENALGEGPVVFTDAVAERFNTRIPAEGLDTTQYTFSAPAGDGNVTFRARLIYRRAWREVIDAKGWTLQGDGVTPLEDLVAPHFGHLMEEATEVVFVTGTGITEFSRGNCNTDAAFDIADAIFVLGYLFPDGAPAVLSCEDACDCNDDGQLDIGDAICNLNALFGSPTQPPVAPYPGCGPDPTGSDALGCDSFPACP